MSFKKLNKNEVINLFTFKPYNFRENMVSNDKIQQNYINLQQNLNYQFHKIITPHQTHTNIVKIVDESNINDPFDNVDGLITNIKGLALVTTLADCQGILLYDNQKKVIGNIHSGWKGTLNRIITNAINIMTSKYQCNLENIEVYLCPSILECCFEVDSDIKNLFLKEFKDININSCISLGKIKEGKQKYLINTVLINKKVMLNLGLKKENIILSNICSKCNSSFIHSYRTDGINSGRNISLICLK